MDTDVLVVGAGPTGLMLANQLMQWNLRVRIIDRHAGPAVQTRALGVQARTLEIYSQLGIAEQALALGKRSTGANIWANGRRAARIPLGDIGRDLSPYPFLLILGQDDNERLLGERLRQRGVAVEWDTELIALSQTADRVTARLRHQDGQISEATAAWVGGCDGARSAVRDLNGIEFQGAPYEHVFFVADTTITGPMVPDEINVYLWPRGFHLFFPMRGINHWRLVGIVPPELRGLENLALDEVVPSIRQETGPGLSFEGCSWFSTYRIHHRRAQRFREGRCFLLGDAAHIHSPVGAQGMNTGLQDAYNLGWKLALVISGRAGTTLLDSYEAERIPVAERLLQSTDRAFSLVVSDSKLAGWIRTRLAPGIMARAMSIPRVQRLAFRTISQTGIHYRNSPQSKTLPGVPATAPRAGDRFPWVKLKLSPEGLAEDLFGKLHPTRYTLIVIGQTAPTNGLSVLGDLVHTVVVPSDPDNDRELTRVHMPRPGFFLVRPDGYIGLAGLELEPGTVRRYASEYPHLKLTAT